MSTPDYVLAASEAVLTSLLPILLRGTGAVSDATIAATTQRRIRLMLADTRAAARSATLAADIRASIDGVRTAAADQRNVIAVFERVIAAARAIEPTAGGSVALNGQRQNEIALAGLFEWSCLAGAARAIATLDFASRDEADGYRRRLSASLTVGIERASDLGLSSVQRSLRELQGRLVRDLIERGRPLARIVTYATPLPLPAVVLAHLLYQDASRAGELVDANPGQAHPSFMPMSGKALSR